MQDAGVQELVRKVLERYKDDERTLDAYWQWASNPTPSAVGYALQENSGFIATNLMNRYGQPAIEVVTRVSADCLAMRQEASVCDLRQAIINVLNSEVGHVLRAGVAERLAAESPARKALGLWLVMRHRWQGHLGPENWLAGEYDWSLGIDLDLSGKDLSSPLAEALWGKEAARFDLAREALAVGVINRMFYRNQSGRMEPKVRPGPRIPLSLLVG